MTVSATFNLRLDVTETLTIGVDGASQPVIQHDQLNVKGTLDATSTPPAAEHSQELYNLVAGAKTIDLTALASTNGRVIDGTGLKVQLLRFENKGANSMTIAKGATNGYDPFGGAVAVTVPAGCAAMLRFNDSLADIDATHKTLDVAGTLAQQFALSVVLG